MVLLDYVEHRRLDCFGCLRTAALGRDRRHGRRLGVGSRERDHGRQGTIATLQGVPLFSPQSWGSVRGLVAGRNQPRVVTFARSAVLAQGYAVKSSLACGGTTFNGSLPTTSCSSFSVV